MFPDISNLDALAFLSHVESKSVSLILTDPPYGTTDEDCDRPLTESYKDALSVEFSRVCRGSLFMFLPVQDVKRWIERLESQNAQRIRVGVWIKYGASLNPVPYPSNALEYWVYCDWNTSSRDDGVLLPVYQCTNTQRLPEWETGNRHPFHKPISLLRTIIHNHSHDDGLILDPFCGSGNVGISSLLENKKFLINDVDMGFVKKARHRIDRFDDYSGHHKLEAFMSAAKKKKSAPKFNAEQKAKIMDLVVMYNLASDADKAKKYTESWFLNSLRGNPEQKDKNKADYAGVLPRNRAADSIWGEVNKIIAMLKQANIADAKGNAISWVSPKRSDRQILKSNIDALVAQHGLKIVKKK